MGRPPVLKWAVRGTWRGSARLMMACLGKELLDLIRAARVGWDGCKIAGLRAVVHKHNRFSAWSFFSFALAEGRVRRED